MFIVVAIVFIGFILFIHLWLPSNIKIVASTNSTVLAISTQTVPTIINGVTTATSIIIGFSGALVGLVAREILKNDEKDRKMREYMIGTLLFLFPIILLIDFGAYFNLLIGGYGFMVAIQWVLSGFLLALLLLVGIFILIWLIIEEHGTNANPTPTTPTQEKKEDKKTKKPESRVRQIAMFFLVLGLSIALIASFVILPRPKTSQFPSDSSRTFAFSTSEELLSNISEFQMYIKHLDLENGKANCTIIAYPYLRNVTELDSVYYVLQVPFRISNLEVVYGVGSPSIYQGDNATYRIGNMTYIFVKIPKGEFVGFKRPPESILQLEYNFIIDSAFRQIDGSSYEFVLTFGSGFENSFDEINYPEDDVPYFYRLYFFNVSRAFLEVERTNKYYYSQLLPSANPIGTSYYWDIEELSTTKDSNSVIVDVSNLDTKAKFDLRYSITWLLLGIGIPMFVSSIIEFVKNQGALKPVDLLKESKKALIISISVSVLILAFFLFAVTYLWS